MSQRTILEFNHDFTQHVKVDPITFGLLLAEHGRAGGTPETIERLKAFGVTVVATVHHSTDRKVVIEGKDFVL